MAKYFLIAGEASGDMHAAALMQQLQQRDPHALFSGLGGDRMQAVGCRLYQDYRHMAFMAFAAVLRNLGQIRRNFRIAEQALLQERPDTLILIDYPSFNLRIAAYCRKHLPKTKIYYYVPPKVWAWKRWRVHRIARLCDEVLAIFPFEPAFYAQYGYTCTYVGNPTVEEIARVKAARSKAHSIAVLPGSRPNEVSNSLPRMLEAARRYPDYRIVVTAAPGIEDDFFTPYLHAGETLTRDTYAAVQEAQAAIVNSGTATLETALLGCPQVAVYHLAHSRLVGLIRRVVQPLMFTIRWFTLVNILAGREVIRECIANDFTADGVAAELGRLLQDEPYRQEMQQAYRQIADILGTQHAAATAAERIVAGND